MVLFPDPSERAANVRIWSLHPKYLDPRGLVSLWREALLAQSVLKRLVTGSTTGGYSGHPQLSRFLEQTAPIACIAEYFRAAHVEAQSRGYRFDAARIGAERTRSLIGVTLGQLEFERSHLLAKLERRAPEWLDRLAKAGHPAPHPLFRAEPGDIADWERP